MLSGQRHHVRSNGGPRLLRRKANVDSQEHKGAKPAFGKQWRVNALTKLQTDRLVARQPVKAGRPVATMRASFTDRTERARMSNRISPSKALAERIVS